MGKYWTLFWFNDYVRIIGVVLGFHLFFTAPLPILLFGVEYARDIILILYASVFVIALFDNDYTKLNKYGYDVYGRKIK